MTVNFLCNELKFAELSSFNSLDFLRYIGASDKLTGTLSTKDFAVLCRRAMMRGKDKAKPGTIIEGKTIVDKSGKIPRIKRLHSLIYGKREEGYLHFMSRQFLDICERNPNTNISWAII